MLVVNSEERDLGRTGITCFCGQLTRLDLALPHKLLLTI